MSYYHQINYTLVYINPYYFIIFLYIFYKITNYLSFNEQKDTTEKVIITMRPFSKILLQTFVSTNVLLIPVKLFRFILNVSSKNMKSVVFFKCTIKISQLHCFDWILFIEHVSFLFIFFNIFYAFFSV